MSQSVQKEAHLSVQGHLSWNLNNIINKRRNIQDARVISNITEIFHTYLLLQFLPEKEKKPEEQTSLFPEV